MERRNSVGTSFYNSLPEDLKRIIMIADLMSPREVLIAKNSDFKEAKTEDIQKLRTIASKYSCGTELVSALTLNSPKKISFGCKSLDICTNGGVVRRGITEICGEGGSGKTQILLQLCLTSQLYKNHEGCRQKVVFLCTEKKFPSNRLNQIVEHFKMKNNEQISFLDGIFINHFGDIKDLIKCCYTKLPNLVKKQNIGLIIIDSIAAVFQSELNYIKRANEMRKIVRILHSLIQQYNIAVVCSNHVVTVENDLVPSLGITWSHLVRTRFKISKIDKTLSSFENLRKFEILYSPELSNKSCTFLIATEGIVDEQI